MNKPIIVRIMRLLTFFLFCGCMQLAAATHSQTVTVRGTNLHMQEVFKLVSQQTGYYIVGFDPVVDDIRHVSVDAENMPLREFLDVLLPAHSLSYSIHKKTIVIKREMAVETTVPPAGTAQQLQVTGNVMDEEGNALPGATISVKGQTKRVVSDDLGRFTISGVNRGDMLVFSVVGFQSEERSIADETILKVVLKIARDDLDEVVVVGYGTQKKRDITGAVASLPQHRLEMVPNTNIAQAIQGSIPGVMVQTSSAGAEPSQSIMIRGRNSIKASNSPLVIVDGIAGNLNDLNPGDVASIEVLKDASAAAIYGSRASNGVILVTTKSGMDGTTKLRYNGFYSTQRFVNIPDLMDGEEFYNFKMERSPDNLTPSELAVYESGEWVDWLSLALRNGKSTQHNLALSGQFKETQYYISGSVTDVTGLAVNDDYLRLTSRINVDTKVRNWLTVGTRTQLSFEDYAGIAPTWDGDQGVFWFNPLTKAFDENGNQVIYPWPDDTYFRNPLMGLLAKDIDAAYQVVTNNYAVVDFPFVKGLQYRINTGLKMRYTNRATYYGRDTQRGLSNRGDAYTNRGQANNIVIENIANYNREFDKHNLFVTGVYSFENSKSGSNSLDAQGFPNDFLTWFSAAQAELVVPDYSYSETSLLSGMFRINYSYDSRYLLTLTGRNDGYSGFGAQTKRGFFPSLAVGWNISQEDFFGWKNIINDLKIRASIGTSGNQAIGAYETISRLSARDMVAGANTLPGYIPSKLGQDNLGWESTRTLNVGIDFGILNNRITGDVNLYKSNTSDLLLDRIISPVHAVTSITQNIGETENRGLELSFVSRNIETTNFKWETTGNISFVKNKIVSLYGELDESGNEINDIANAWFIGQPILVNYGFLWDGVWQLDEAEQAAAYGTRPGYIKIKDISGPDGIPDGVLSPDYDRIIIGQRDPKYIWGMNNSFSYKSLTLNLFIHGVHGVTKNNALLSDGVGRTVRLTTTKKNWWRPDNPTNDWYMNDIDANLQGGYSAEPYENAGFVRIKDISLAYNLPKDKFSRLGIDRLQVYLTGRNLFTFTGYGGLDPELGGQRGVPLQKEYVFGINLDF